jgi:hypothetical protein
MTDLLWGVLVGAGLAVATFIAAWFKRPSPEIVFSPLEDAEETHAVRVEEIEEALDSKMEIIDVAAASNSPADALAALGNKRKR